MDINEMKTLWCPGTRLAPAGTNRGSTGGVPEGSKCIGPACVAFVSLITTTQNDGTCGYFRPHEVPAS